MSTTDGMILGALIVFGVYLVVAFVWSMIEGVAVIVRGVRHWWHRNDQLILGALWHVDSIELLRKPVDNPSSGRPD